MDAKTLDNTLSWYDKVLNARDKGRLTILTGSAISMFGPTFLPSGSDASSLIKENLIDEFLHKEEPIDNNRRDRLRQEILESIRDLPFESTMQLLGAATNNATAERFIHNLIKTDTFNMVHEIIAGWMAKVPRFGTPPLAIITTNYDLGIENAIDDIYPGLNFQRIIIETDVPKRFGGDPILFKIHGSDSTISSYNFVYTHDQEAALHAWQVKLLHKLIDDRVLLVIGYSGMDQDILPAIDKCKNFVFMSIKELEGLSQKGLYKFTGSLKKGNEIKNMPEDERDLRNVLEQLYRKEINIDLKQKKGEKSKSECTERILSAMKNLSSEQKALWFTYMIINSGNWKLGMHSLEYVNGKDNPKKIIAKASALFYAGKYIASAEQNWILLKNYSKGLSIKERIDTYCSLAGCFNNAGAFWRTWAMLFRAIFLLPILLFSKDRKNLLNSLGPILEGAFVSIPGTSKLLKSEMIQEIVTNIIKRTGSVSTAAVVKRFSEPTSEGLSFGERAALINQYRYIGQDAVDKLERGDYSIRHDALEWLNKSIGFANKNNDYPGLCKGYLELWRLNVIINHPEEALMCWKKGWQYAKNVEYVGWRRSRMRRFKMEAERIAGVTSISTKWNGTSKEKSYRLGKLATFALSVK